MVITQSVPIWPYMRRNVLFFYPALLMNQRPLESWGHSCIKSSIPRNWKFSMFWNSTPARHWKLGVTKKRGSTHPEAGRWAGRGLNWQLTMPLNIRVGFFCQFQTLFWCLLDQYVLLLSSPVTMIALASTVTAWCFWATAKGSWLVNVRLTSSTPFILHVRIACVSQTVQTLVFDTFDCPSWIKHRALCAQKLFKEKQIKKCKVLQHPFQGVGCEDKSSSALRHIAH